MKAQARWYEPYMSVCGYKDHLIVAKTCNSIDAYILARSEYAFFVFRVSAVLP